MTKEMVISANRHETKVAVLEDDQLVEVYFQRANEYSLAGSIHKGRVTRVLPGMQSAFVDLGLERDTFLYVSDFFEENEDFDPIPAERESRHGRDREHRAAREDRSARAEAPPPDIAAPVVEALPDAAAFQEISEPESPVDVTPDPSAVASQELVQEAPASAPAAAPPHDRGNRNDRGDRGDDRNRRSRRRRNRGRGFPESKYASSPSYAPPERPAPPEHHVEPPSAVEPSESAGDFSVLPGESLAKYRHAAVPMLDSGEQEEIEAASAATEHTLEQTTPEEYDSAEIEESAAADPEPEIAEAPAIEPEPEPAPEKDPEPPAAEVAETALPEAAPPEAASAEAALAEALEAMAGVNPEDETVGAEDNESAAAVDSDESHEEQPSASSSGPVTAAVREHGGRYLQHRTSRRMRRKMRSQGRPEGEPRRPEGDNRREDRHRDPEPVPAPPTASEPSKPEVRAAPRPDRGAVPSITDLLKEGQEILVQIAKEPLGQKGARITSHIALPGRYVVYMPTLEHMGVSRKIASDEERLRLKRILQAHHSGIQGGFIVRTAGEGKSEADIAADMNFLSNLWLDIRQKAEKRPAPLLLHHDLDIVQRLLRDQFTENFKAIWVDSEEIYESILRFVQRFQPALVTRIKLYTRTAPIFDAFNITPELEKALRPKVWLKSGGYIVINQTEALVAIDVNTGKFVGKSNRLEDTIVKTNTEAVKEIVRQVRLRDLGGIIVVDFIDMDERKNRQKVMQVLEEAMRADKAPYKILQFNDFGLVAITRKRVKQSLERALCSPCPYCEGAGYVKSVQTIVGEILQEAHKITKAVESESNVILRVNPEVAKTLKSTQNRYLEELESILRKPVMVKSDPSLHHEKFDLA
jgi:ribonuclease G